MEFKDKVKSVRKKLYLTQDNFAKELGVAFATVNRWESGRCKPNTRAIYLFNKFCTNHAIELDGIDWEA